MRSLTKIALFACLLSPLASLEAQITVQESDFLKIFYIGDTLSVRILQDTAVNIGQLGGPNVYDFSSLNLVSGGSVPIVLGSSDPDAASRFPHDTVMVQPKSHQALTFTPSGMYDLGKVTILNDSTLDYVHRSPAKTIFRFPIAFGGGYSESGTTVDTVYTKGVLDSVGGGPEGQVGAVDGYGTLKLPGGVTYPCLRVTRYENPPCTTCNDDLNFSFVTTSGLVIIINADHTQPDTGRIKISGFSVLQGRVLTGVPRVSQSPSTFALEQNYPNPFNPSTQIAFEIPQEGFVTLKVYDVLGRELATLVDGRLAAGSYRRTFDAHSLTSGVYFYRLAENNFVQTAKMLLIR